MCCPERRREARCREERQRRAARGAQVRGWPKVVQGHSKGQGKGKAREATPSKQASRVTAAGQGHPGLGSRSTFYAGHAFRAKQRRQKEQDATKAHKIGIRGSVSAGDIAGGGPFLPFSAHPTPTNPTSSAAHHKPCREATDASQGLRESP
ncbi:hypothetical protein E2C01_045510 [Portunus trituberculatus]|uniref:Uncharacterized protein n=1 Tax=Portunus trituberculatus TaxID=210409 RepID=A0A5B7G3C6_PORTR|nr:hypothetical protein [Portunus trituberculatus]